MNWLEAERLLRLKRILESAEVTKDETIAGLRVRIRVQERLLKRAQDPTRRAWCEIRLRNLYAMLMQKLLTK